MVSAHFRQNTKLIIGSQTIGSYGHGTLIMVYHSNARQLSFDVQISIWAEAPIDVHACTRQKGRIFYRSIGVMNQLYGPVTRECHSHGAKGVRRLGLKMTDILTQPFIKIDERAL